MTGPTVGSASVTITPDVRNFARDLRAKLDTVAQVEGARLGKTIGDAAAPGIVEGIERGLRGADPSGSGRRQGAQYGDAYSREVITRVDAALKALPNAEVGIDAGVAETKLANIRRELIGLTDESLSVRVDDATALAVLATLRAELDELTGPEHDIRVRVNAAAAQAELAALQANIDKAVNPPDDGKPLPVKKKADDAAKSVSLLGTSIALLGPALVPLGAVAAASLGALGGLAGSALLGVKAIQQDLKDGAGVGTEFASGLAQVKGNLQDLGEVAASNLLQPFQSSVEDLNGRMPQLRGEVAEFSTEAGIAGQHIVSGLVGGFQTLEPLFVRIGSDFDGLTQRFDAYANGGGLVKFSQFAQANLPTVEQDVEDIATAIGHVVAGIAPLGVSSLSTLGAFARVVNAIPIPVLRVAAPLITGLYLAIQGGKALSNASGAINEVITKVIALGVAETATAGEVTANTVAVEANTAATVENGVASGAAAGKVAQVFTGLGAFASTAAGGLGIAAAGVAALTFGLAKLQQQVTGVQTSQTSNVFKELFGGLAGLQSGITGGVQDKINQDQAKSAAAAQAAVQAAVDKYNGSLQTEAQQLGITSQQASAYAAIIGDTQAQVTSGTITQLQYNNGVASIAAIFNTATATGSTFLDALQAFSTSAGTAADRAKLISATLIAGNGDALSYAGTINSVATANQTLVSSFDKAQRATIDLKTGTIDYTQAAAAPLLANLQALQTAAANAAGATFQHELATKGNTQAALDATAVFKNDTYGALVSQASQLHLTTQQAQALATQYFNMPKDVTTDVQAEGTEDVVSVLSSIGNQLAFLTGHPFVSHLAAADAASGIIRTVSKELSQLNGSTATVTVLTQQSAHGNYTVGQIIGQLGHGNVAEAMGGILQAFAAGGFSENHAPQIARTRPGTVRVWAEPETKGEAYIPLANDHRRSGAEAILSTVASMFGGAYTPHADGGLSAYMPQTRNDVPAVAPAQIAATRTAAGPPIVVYEALNAEATAQAILNRQRAVV